MSPLQHAGAMAVLKWITEYHSAVQEEGKSKTSVLGVKEARAVNSRAFTTYRITLDMVPSSKYLRRVLLTADHDWMAVIQTDKGAGG